MRCGGVALVAVLSLCAAPVARAQAAPGSPATERRSAAAVASFLGGGAVALGIHEGAHLVFDVAFDANPRVKKVEFWGIPFFAIAHRNDLSPRREFTISSAGFWAQHATNEILLSQRPRLREARQPFIKGVVAFNVLASVAYGGAALGRVGPDERDTRGMAQALGVDERWVGAMVLVPAVLDAYRYFHPDAAWARWGSRGAKIAMVLLVVK